MGGCLSSREPIDFDGPVDFMHFEILRAIGKGAFGKVCIVKKKDSKEMYAMKYMNKIQIIQKRATDNVFREITILKALEHPFIVNLWFAFQDEEDIFVVLDLMLGGDLSYHLEKDVRFSLKRVQLYVAETCFALDYLKEKNIIHRDIKPANMLLDSKGHIHLTDFNVACFVKEGKTVTSMTGTKPYMAPEVVRGGVGYTYSVDWWSLGVSAYEMLRGERPYPIHQAMNNQEMYSMLTKIRPPASARWDDSTCDLLKVLLHPDPSKRLCTLERAKGHSFFNDLDWEAVLRCDITPPYVPSQNRIHCDPTHELEEMIVEPNPLHKKKSRLSKKHKELDPKLESELNKMQDRFNSYNRIREQLGVVETHDDDEETETILTSSYDRVQSTVTTTLSLPRQDSPINSIDDNHPPPVDAPINIDVEVHDESRKDSGTSIDPLLPSKTSHKDIIVNPMIDEEDGGNETQHKVVVVEGGEGEQTKLVNGGNTISDNTMTGTEQIDNDHIENDSINNDNRTINMTTTSSDNN